MPINRPRWGVEVHVSPAVSSNSPGSGTPLPARVILTPPLRLTSAITCGRADKCIRTAVSALR